MAYPLFKYFPRLRKSLPIFHLGSFPTSVLPLNGLRRQIRTGQLFVKRDDLSGRTYGGNKIRKLEFLLGEALRQEARTVITFGAAGSNHALATSLYGARAGLKCISILFPQRSSPSVGRNLLAGFQAGADLQYMPDFKRSGNKTRLIINKASRQDGRPPAVIPPGGSSPLGTIGFVNAAFELRGQIENNLLPEPDLIYLPSGTMGTCAGLLLGLTAAGLKSRVMAVKVTPRQFSNEIKFRQLYNAANRLLHECDPSFPIIPFPNAQGSLRPGFLGQGYGIFSRAGMEAVELMKEHEGLNLEGTYTGKAFAALVEDGRKGYLEHMNVLFWNTYNSQDIYKASAGLDYRKLPEPFHIYFRA